MNQPLKNTLLFFILCVSINAMFASSNYNAALQNDSEEVPEKGYWVIENKKSDPRHHIIYFYAEDGSIAYKESIDGIKLKINNKLKKQLNRVLNKVICIKENQQPPIYEKDMVLAGIGRKD